MGSIIKGILRISIHPTGKTSHTQERDGSEDDGGFQVCAIEVGVHGEDDEGNGVRNNLMVDAVSFNIHS